MYSTVLVKFVFEVNQKEIESDHTTVTVDIGADEARKTYVELNIFEKIIEEHRKLIDFELNQCLKTKKVERVQQICSVWES